MEEILKNVIKDFNEYLFKNPANSNYPESYLKGIFFTTFRRYAYNYSLKVEDISELIIKNRSLHFVKFGGNYKYVPQDKKIMFATLNSIVGNIDFNSLQVEGLYFFNFLHQSNSIIESINNYKI